MVTKTIVIEIKAVVEIKGKSTYRELRLPVCPLLYFVHEER